MLDFYTEKMSINHTNSKSKGSPIVNLDSVRGCGNNCDSCYAKRNSCKSIKHFDNPVPVRVLIGKSKDDHYYRFGNFGDPAYDWQHTENLISRYHIKKFFVVTKLQTLNGFTGFVKNIQVSVDPLIPDHFKITMNNIKILLELQLRPNIVMRIRSVSSMDQQINKLQYEAVSFANTNSIPVLETRIRFTEKKAINKHNLVASDYSYRKGYLRSNYGTRFLRNVTWHFVCDEEEVKCKGCLNCIKLFDWNNNNGRVYPNHTINTISGPTGITYPLNPKLNLVLPSNNMLN